MRTPVIPLEYAVNCCARRQLLSGATSMPATVYTRTTGALPLSGAAMMSASPSRLITLASAEKRPGGPTTFKDIAACFESISPGARVKK
jgi:hypothetical protein